MMSFEIVERIKKAVNHSVEEQKKKQVLEESTKISLDSAMLFSGSNDKGIKATFRADGRNIFDLTKQRQGSIFRLERLDKQGKPIYNWFVIGKKIGDKVVIHQVQYGGPDVTLETHGDLPFKPTLSVSRGYLPVSNEFLIEETMQTLLKVSPQAVMDNFPTSTKVDLMFAGIKEKVPQKNYTSVPQFIFSPQRKTA